MHGTTAGKGLPKPHTRGAFAFTSSILIQLNEHNITFFTEAPVQIAGGGTGRKTGDLETELSPFSPVVLDSAVESKGWPQDVVLILMWP